MAAAGTVRMAIVGMGIGKANGLALAANPRCRVVALCDLVEDRMAEFAAELPGEQEFFTDYKQMCRDRSIDAIFVGTPNQLHVPIAVEAVRRDKHVLVTKPLADSERAAARLVEVAEKAGVVNMMSLSTRFSPACQYLQARAESGYFGELYYGRARSVRRNGIPAWNLGFIAEGGGAFRDMGVHVLDAAWSIMGRPRPATVTGVSGAPFGPRGLGYSRPISQETYRQFAADDYAGARLSPLTIYRTEDGVEEDTSVNLPARGGSGSWDNIAAHFIDCILDGTECTAPLRHGLQVQQMMEALLKSASTGREVRLRNYRS